MGLWAFRCYDVGDRGCPWRRWYDDLAEEFQASHDEVFDRLETQLIWTTPDVDFIDKENRIIEIRLTGNVKHRIGGFHAGTRKEFVVLGFWYHKQRVYTPADIKKTLAKRKKEVIAYPERAVSCARPQGTE